LTEWEEFKKIDFNKVKRLMLTPIVLDGRNLLDSKMMEKFGFIYKSIGRT
jgi:UDPglucose 6-dehydrogenase